MSEFLAVVPALPALSALPGWRAVVSTMWRYASSSHVVGDEEAVEQELRTLEEHLVFVPVRWWGLEGDLDRTDASGSLGVRAVPLDEHRHRVHEMIRLAAPGEDERSSRALAAVLLRAMAVPCGPHDNRWCAECRSARREAGR